MDKKKIAALPPCISKADLCQLLEVPRIRNLRSNLLTNDFITTELKLTIGQFNNRQRFTPQESIIIKQHLLKMLPKNDSSEAA
jgi:hypothetical protein